jgi:hypothetical protein
VKQGFLRGIGHFEPLPIATHTLAGTVDELTTGSLGFFDDRGNLGVADVEHLVQEKGGSLVGREPLEQRQERHGQVVGQIELPVWRRVRHDRFRQPLPDVRLALGLQPPQPIDRQPAGCGHQPRFRVFDTRPIDLVPAKISLLDDVLGVGARTQHPVRQAEEASTQCFEGCG